MMKPYYQDAQVTLYHGDCREILPTLGPVDLVITDPPYQSLDIAVKTGTTTRLTRREGGGTVARGPRRGGGGGAMSVSVTRPALRYHGGKWRLAPWIISHFPAHRCYVEPFGGGASVLLRKPRSYAEVYNDLDGEVVNLFRVLREDALREQLVRAIALTPFARAEFDRSVDSGANSAIERARRLCIRSHMGFATAALRSTRNGRLQSTGFRANVSRNGTTPAHDWTGLPDVLRAVGERFAGVVIEHRDACQVIATHDAPDTLHYVDPPYPHDTRSNASRWNYRHEMSDEDHRTLAATLHTLTGMVVLSGYPCDLYDRELFPDWRRVTKPTHADGARQRTEVLWLNPRAASAL